MFLNREHRIGPLLNNRLMRRLAAQHLRDMGVDIPDVTVEAAKLSGGQRQAIAVARSVYSDARILLLDEPLAAMGAKEATIILDLVSDLKQRGDVAVVIIAHNYAQALQVCDRVNILQHGRITFDRPTAETSVVELTELMVAEYRGRRGAAGGHPPRRPDTGGPSSSASIDSGTQQYCVRAPISASGTTRVRLVRCCLAVHELDIVRVMDSPEAIHVRYRVRR